METAPEKKKRARQIIRLLKKEYPDARCSLDYSNPLELLVATILSAQCTDERVNLVTADLFRKYRSWRDYADASAAEQLQPPRDKRPRIVRLLTNAVEAIADPAATVAGVTASVAPSASSHPLATPRAGAGGPAPVRRSSGTPAYATYAVAVTVLLALVAVILARRWRIRRQDQNSFRP